MGAVILAAAFAFWKLPGGNLVTGLLSGLAIAGVGVFLYSALPPQAGSNEKGPFWLRYMGGAFLRYTVMIVVFCAAVFAARINRLGLLIGAFAGMMVATFVFLNKMRHVPPGAAREQGHGI